MSRRLVRRKTHIAFASMIAVLVCVNAANAQSSAEAIKTLQSLTTGDQSTLAATKSIQQLSAAKDITLIQSLSAMKVATPLGRNWLSGLANSLYRKSGASQSAELTKFLADQSQDGEARYLVFQWLTAKKADLRKELLTKMNEDSSPELRFLSIEEAMKDKLETKQLSSLLEAARHPSQVVSIIDKLKEREVTVDQSKQLGFIPKWRLIGPFDHVGTANFDKAFPIETDWASGKVKDEYDGKSGIVKWRDETTAAPDGMVNLAEIYEKEKGCIIYRSNRI